ncbi:cell division cycle 7-related protein kinase isoform X1 [Harpegnathos saltator]|uniref:cell division cycle 7-related protein kinase isoform X1 n=1 Tax=Harpegnathos saltator TaxID=610380 RepID=UPI000DBED8A6|nr:cell division cycle 7-related protein kinase isoform X1 [Harpegnathos saltator]XP_025161088.1 cell division cycle 7-related protein kinase isoform X1 [Harpegnathos saltator]
MEIDDTYKKHENDDAKETYTNLRKSIPQLEELFHIHHKVGEGAFSSVFLATLKSSNRRKKFALKYLIPTCHPERIERELKCLQQIGGKEYIVNLELCLRNHGSVVFVMPYMKHDKFPDYVKDMTVEETKAYMRALLSALRRVHKFDIIHRDVKPSNFLYDRTNRKYLLVDFGLAQQSTTEDFKTTKETNIKSMNITPAVKRKRSDENNVNLQLNTVGKRTGDNKCYCFGKPKVCSLCLTKPQEQAPRAGTPGFRAPEVLLKYSSQTSAIDIWASGVMMLCILSGTQPFFRSPDDCTALAEITSMFGTHNVQQCAQKLGKKVIFSNNLPGIDIMPLCQKLQKRNRSMTYDKDSTCKKVLPDIEYPKEAYHLLMKLLDLDYKTRITADQALSHPFLRESL